LIIPFLESRFDFDWNFKTDFPYSQDPRLRGQLAPGLISQIEDLIKTYLQDPNHPKWKSKWALVYDSVGDKRYAIAIVQAASDSLEPCDDQRFAAAFDQVAQKVYVDTGVKVGFFIDPIPRHPDPAVTYGCRDVRGSLISTYDARFRPDPDATGPWLYKQSSILGIHAYSPEGWIDAPDGQVDECLKIAWKEDFSRRWQATGIPFLQDVTPGYDGSKLFDKWPGLHRWGYTANWRASLVEMVSRYGRKGMVYNSWNGYCEGLAAMETEQPDKNNVDFIRRLMSTY